MRRYKVITFQSLQGEEHSMIIRADAMSVRDGCLCFLIRGEMTRAFSPDAWSQVEEVA